MRHILQLTFFILLRLAISHFYRIAAPADLHHRCTGKMFGETLCIKRSRGNDQFEVAPARQDLHEIAEQEVDIERALMRLIEDDSVVFFQQGIALDFGEQYSVRHQLDAGVGRHTIIKTNLVTNHSAQLGLQLKSDAACHRARRHSPWLGVGNRALHPATYAQANLRQLRSLARTRLAAHDDHLMLCNRFGQFFTTQHHRQIGGILQRS